MIKRKKYAQKFGFDWRLFAGICYQESIFKQNIKNKWGAIGLFQVKQTTAHVPYVGISIISGGANFDNNIFAGMNNLAWTRKRPFNPKKKISEEVRLRMMMAAYNASPRRGMQAINKSKGNELYPKKWSCNVELAMFKLGYSEPVVYVSEINKPYVSVICSRD